MRLSRLLIATGLVALAGAGAVAAQWAAMGAIEEQLAQNALQGGVRSVAVGSARWSGVRGRGVEVGSLTLSLLPTPRVFIEEVRVDLDKLQLPDRPLKTGGGPQGAAISVPVDLAGLQLRVGGAPLMPPLSGTVLPTLDLVGPQSSLVRSPGGGFRASLAQPVSFGPLSGDAAVTVDCANARICSFQADVSEAVLDHPLLAPRPLEPVALHGEGTLSVADRTAEAVFRVDGVPVSLAVDADRQLRVEAAEVPFASLLAPFVSQVPEARHAEVDGTVGGVAVFDLPSQRLVSLHPTASGLKARGVVPNPGALATGSVTWRAPLDGGDWVVRTTGRGWPGWTPLSEAGLVPAAMVAAEDAAFWRHEGLHMPAVTEAITESLSDPAAALRGGSTITQQLAKNLFCDPGDRTLARKLSELLYALELEAILPKQRILELYINIVELGPQVYGVGPAADAYFIKRPARMTPSEAAFLASILPAPRTYYRRALGGNPPRARMAFVLDNMANGGVLTAHEAAVAKARPPRIVPLGNP